MAVEETQSSPASALAVEQNGINVIAESERRGQPRDLFWPWCAANISVLAISYGSFLLAFGIGFWQGVFAGVVGTVFSFLLVGIVSLAGKRGSAPTMVLSRAPFGVRGNNLPTAVSYLLLVGWETVLVTLATLATATVFGRLGWSDGDVTKVIAFLVVAAIIIVVGCLGFTAIMRLQTLLTVVLAVLTVGYIALTVDEIDWDAVSAMPSGSGRDVLGALIFAATALGLGWVNAGADYSRYQRRTSSSSGVVWWTTFGGSIAPIVLIVYGLLLAGSDPELSTAIAADPIGALTTALPTWFLLPFALVAVFGLVAGAVLDIYSSGLALLTLGVRIPRWSAALIDGVIMMIGTIWLVFFADDILGPFQAFLITLGVPIAAWCGVFIADLLLRRRDYVDADLYTPAGRYGPYGWVAIGLMIVGTFLGWGLVTGLTDEFDWLGYLLDPFGLGGKDGDWAFANLGVLVALAVGFIGYALLGRGRVRAQDEQPVMPEQPAQVG